MTEIPIVLQFIALLVAIAGGIALPFVLFILADMRARLHSLETLVRVNSTHTTTHAAQLAFITEAIKGYEKREGF